MATRKPIGDSQRHDLRHRLILPRRRDASPYQESSFQCSLTVSLPYCFSGTEGVKTKKPGNSESQGGRGLELLPGAIRNKQGDGTVSIHASGAVPGDSPLRADRHVSCVAVPGEPCHVQRGGKVRVSPKRVKTISISSANSEHSL